MSENKMLDTRDADGITVVKVRVHEIAETEIEAMTRELGELLARDDARSILVNLEDVRFLTSSAIGMFIATQKKLKGLGGSLKLCCLHPEIHQLFQITQVDRLFDIRRDEDEAVASFA